MRVLLAEDDPHISVIAKLCLEKLGGFVVTVVNDGEAALKEALSENYDLILLDEMMPKMNGLRVCHEYKARSQQARPVIFLSAKTQELDLKEFSTHALGSISKPFDPMTLAQQIHALLTGAA